MQRFLVIITTVLTFALSGCFVMKPKPRAGTKPAAAKGKQCPPGHLWSDGKCHAKGKGHDPAKHKGKAKGHDKEK